jgi:hypothetical protein
MVSIIMKHAVCAKISPVSTHYLRPHKEIYIYTKALFYTLVVFLKKVSVTQKGVNQEWYSHQK